jgi:CRP-like cAMP-binding protein
LTLEQTLRNHAFTHGLAEAQIAKLALLATEVTFAEDEVILVASRRSEYFYLVLTGSVTVELHTPTFTVSVQALGPGQAFGWSALLDHQDTLFQVRARERTTTLRVAGSDLSEICRSDPALGTEILLRTLHVVAGRVKATEAKFAEMCGIRVAPNPRRDTRSGAAKAGGEFPSQ